MLLLGYELSSDKSLGTLARVYCLLFGAPMLGLHIRWRKVKSLLPKTASRILDAGCGRGVITRAVAKKYPDAKVEAIDELDEFQKKNQFLAESMGLQNCTFIHDNLLELNEEDIYDLILSVDNLEHIEDDVKVLSNFFTAMQSGGTLLVHVPHYYRRWPVFKRKVNFEVPGHVRPGYHLPEMIEKIRAAGFLVENSGFSYGFMENLSNNISYVITGAQERNRALYAVVYPLLYILAWFGKWSSPSFGAGVWVLARKP